MGGIELHNVGQSSSPATITHVVVRNACGIGILSDRSSSIIQSNDLHDLGAEGIYIDGASGVTPMSSKVTSNTLANTGGIHLLSGLNIAGINPGNTLVNANRLSGASASKVLGIAGIRVDGYVGATISLNTITSGQISLVDASNNAVINNTLMGTGIFLGGDPFGPWAEGTDNNTIKGNTISGANITLFSSTANLIQYNAIANGGISIDDWINGAGANQVTNNTVNEAACGIMTANVFMTVFAPNSFFNVTSNFC